MMMVKKKYDVPCSNTIGTKLRCTILAGSVGVSQTQQAAGVPGDTPKVDTSKPLPTGKEFDLYVNCK